MKSFKRFLTEAVDKYALGMVRSNGSVVGTSYPNQDEYSGWLHNDLWSDAFSVGGARHFRYEEGVLSFGDEPTQDSYHSVSNWLERKGMKVTHIWRAFSYRATKTAIKDFDPRSLDEAKSEYGPKGRIARKKNAAKQWGWRGQVQKSKKYAVDSKNPNKKKS